MQINSTHLPLEILRGNSIQLEPLTSIHREALRLAADDIKIWAYMPMQAHGIFYDNWFEDCMTKNANGIYITYAIRRLSDSVIIGSRSYYDMDYHHKRLEIGYGWFTPAVWGKIFNHESLWLLFQNAFEQWHFNRVQIGTDPRNKRSYNTLKKLGAVSEGILRQHMIHHQGLITDTAMFSVLASEWPHVKDIFMKRLHQY
jgi:RimJ/RimL family protein N-acetyltransferase